MKMHQQIPSLTSSRSPEQTLSPDKFKSPSGKAVKLKKLEPKDKLQQLSEPRKPNLFSSIQMMAKQNSKSKIRNIHEKFQTHRNMHNNDYVNKYLKLKDESSRSRSNFKLQYSSQAQSLERVSEIKIEQGQDYEVTNSPTKEISRKVPKIRKQISDFNGIQSRNSELPELDQKRSFVQEQSPINYKQDYSSVTPNKHNRYKKKSEMVKNKDNQQDLAHQSSVTQNDYAEKGKVDYSKLANSVNEMQTTSKFDQNIGILKIAEKMAAKYNMVADVYSYQTNEKQTKASGYYSVNKSQNFDSMNTSSIYSVVNANVIPQGSDSQQNIDQFKSLMVNEVSPKNQSVDVFPAVSADGSIMKQYINLENKFNESFIMTHQLHKTNANYRLMHSCNQAKLRNARVGPMMSRKIIQKTHELHCLENMATRLPKNLRASEKALLSPRSLKKQEPVPNVLGTKLKTLDLLVDQRDEIERIVKKQKKNIYKQESPKWTERDETKVLSQWKPPQTEVLNQPKTIKEIKSNLDQCGSETNRSQKPSKGGGFFSPTKNYITQEIQPTTIQVTPVKNIPNTFKTVEKNLQNNKSFGQLPKITSEPYVVKDVMLNSRSLFHQEPQPVLKSGQMQLHKRQPLKKKKSKEKSRMRPMAEEQNIMTPPDMKKNLNLIIDNNLSLEKQVEKNGQVQKDRMYQFQNDFVVKMDKMNKELQKEVESQFSNAEKNEKQELYKQRRKKGVVVKKNQTKQLIQENIENVALDAVEQSSITSEDNLFSNKQLFQGSHMKSSRKVSMPELGLSASITMHNDHMSESINTKIEYSDWLSIDELTEQNDNETENQEQYPEYLRKESFPQAKCYTPSTDNARIPVSDAKDIRWRQVEDQMMKLKQEQRDFYNNKDTVHDSKEMNHIHCNEIKMIEENYMPIIKKIQEKLTSLDKYPCKPPSKNGQVIQINTTNADQSKVRSVAIKKFVDGIHQQSEFFGIAKHATSAVIFQKKSLDPRASFYQKCQDENVVAIPTLAKIQGKVLNLKSYQLNQGSCKALGQAFSLYNDILEKLYLESVGTNDEMFATILKGLTEQQCFKAITYKHNQLDLQSCEIIVKMIKRPMPQNLDQLRIVNCRIGPKAIQTLLPQLHDSNLRRLSLVKAGINSTLLIHILNLITKSRSLIELDISWNNLLPWDLKKLFEVLSGNRQLQNLNISWNNIQELEKKNLSQLKVIEETKLNLSVQIKQLSERVEHLKSLEIPDEESQNELVSKEEERLQCLEKKHQDIIDSQEMLTEDEEFIVSNLGKFIKYNKCLLQLDLSHTQMGTNLMKQLVTQLRRAKSLLCLDVSGNIGITDSLRKYLSERIRCKPDPLDLERLIYIQELIHLINKNQDDQELKNEKILKSMQMRTIKQVTNRTKTDRLTQIRTFQHNENLIYQRILGHKEDIPGSGQWIETSTQTTPPEIIDDWISSKNIYTLVFWSKNFDKIVQSRQQYKQNEIYKLASLLKEPDLNNIKSRMKNMKNKLQPFPVFTDGQTIFPEHEDESPPLFAGSLTNWQYHPMYKLQDFVMMLDPHFSDPVQDMVRRRQIDEDTKFEDFTQNQFRMYMKTRLKTQRYYKRHWLTSLMNHCIRFKNPCLINLNDFDDFPTEDQIQEYERIVLENMPSEELRDSSPSKKKENNPNINQLIHNLGDSDEIYVGVAMSRPGRHTYIVRSETKVFQNLKLTEQITSFDTLGKKLLEQKPNDLIDKFEFSMHRCLIPARDEEIPPFVKSPKSKINQRVFKKEFSVFRDWKEDTPHSLQACFKADSINWKLHKFIKDSVDLQKTEDVLKENFVKIKKIFISEAAKSGFPCINWISYSDYCNLCKVQDQNCNLASIDRAFIATNVELEKHDENPATALERYELLEILVRLSQIKFKDPGICNTYYESIQKLLDEHIFKFGDIDEWQEFRDNELWTIDVNDVLEANQDLLLKIYQSYFEPRKKFMTMKDAYSLMMKDSNLNLIEKDAIYCYGMCKMTVEKENEHNKQYFELKFVEFLEMIGRIANIKYKNTTVNDMTLAKKIEFVLDDIIFPILGTERKEVSILVVEESESDDDY